MVIERRSPNLLLSVIVPAYNEAATIESALRRIRHVALRLEVIAVDDASTDGTREILDGLADIGLVDQVIHHDKNRGKGAAIRSGTAVATGDVVVVQDADLEYDPADVPGLIEPIVRGDADVVFGSRLSGGRPQRGSRSPFRRWPGAGRSRTGGPSASAGGSAASRPSSRRRRR